MFSFLNNFVKSGVNLYSKSLKEAITYRAFKDNFEIIQANTPELKKEVYKLRYEIYCLENPFEDPKNYPDEMEYDQYDQNSIHMLVKHKDSGIFLGTQRLILPNRKDISNSYPLQEVCNDPRLQSFNSLVNTCEVSRFGISKKRRDEALDQTKNIIYRSEFYRKILKRICTVGIIKAVFEAAINNGIHECYGVMEPKYIKNFVNIGMKHEVIGDSFEYHGKRQAFKINLLDLMDAAVGTEFHFLWNIVTDKGFLHSKAESQIYFVETETSKSSADTPEIMLMA